MNNLGITLNDFLPESGWEDRIWGKSVKRYGREAASLTRFNTELKISDDALTTENGKRSVYLDLGSPINSGVLKISFKAMSPSRGIGFVLSSGTDSRSPVEVACNQELSDDVFLNIDIRNNEVRYCSSKPNKNDANILYTLTDGLFEYNKWYNVKLVLDYDALNSSLDKSNEKWISFSMSDENGESLVDTKIPHLTQAISKKLNQFRVIVKEGSLIKDFILESSLSADELSACTDVQTASLDTDDSIIEVHEDIDDITDENIVRELSNKVIVGEDEIIKPEYIFINDSYSEPLATYEDLLNRRREAFVKAKKEYQTAMAQKYIDTSKLSHYNFGIDENNNFSDIDTLKAIGYKCIYIGYENADQNPTSLYGTYEGRNSHVIPKRDLNRCDLICNDDNASEIINIALNMYAGEPTVITFLDGDYKLDVNDGACIKLNRDNVIFRTFSQNTNITFKDKSYVDKDVKILDTNGHSDISMIGFNLLIENMTADYEYYNYPSLSDDTSSVIEYVQTLDEYPGISKVSMWIENGLPSEIIENIRLKEDNVVLQEAIMELATMISEVAING